MPSEDTKILEFIRYQKFDKTPFISSADLNWIFDRKKIDGCKNNSEKTSIVNVGEHTPSGLFMSTIFEDIENKHDVYQGNDCMKTFSESLKEQAKNIINLKKKDEVINKQTAGIILKCKNLLYF